MKAKYFIDNDSLLFQLSGKYFDQQCNDVKYQFKSVLQTDNYFSNLQMNQLLIKNTFETTQYPFGLIDKKIDIGLIQDSEDEIKYFNSEIVKSLDFIHKNSELMTLLKNNIKYFVPLKENGPDHKFRVNGSGCSIHWIKGAVFLSLPYDKTHRKIELALNIVHELGHQALMIYQDIDELIPEGLEKHVYSAVRKTTRPEILSFHALVAIYYMIVFVKQSLQVQTNSFESEYLAVKFDVLKKQFLAGAFALKDIAFTDLGRNLFNEMISEFEVIIES
jgi:hypothetical protein